MSNEQSAAVVATMADDVYALTKQPTKEKAFSVIKSFYL